MEKNIISFGAGQNSPPMVHLLKNKIDEVLFANVGDGCERPETDIFLKEFKKYCIKNNIKFNSIYSPYGNIYDYYFKKKLIPFRMFRSCTHRFKIITMNKYIKEKYPNDIINFYIEIGSDEKKRATKFKNTKKIKYKFPLIENNIDRPKCIKIIKEMNLSKPVKSGCWFCPFQSIKSWRDLYNDYPELFEQAIRFEQNCSQYPKYTLLGTKKLIDLKKSIIEQTSLTQFESLGLSKCDYCHT